MVKPTWSVGVRCHTLVAAPAAALVLCAASLTPASAAGNLCISMADSKGKVAGIQVDLKYDSACMSADQDNGLLARCTAEPTTGKEVRAAIRPGPTLKAIFFSLTDTDPISDGNLFCCSFTRSSRPASACCDLTMSNILGSDSVGKAIPASDLTLAATMDGQACAASPAGSGDQAPVRSGFQEGGGGGCAVASTQHNHEYLLLLFPAAARLWRRRRPRLRLPPSFSSIMFERWRNFDLL